MPYNQATASPVGDSWNVDGDSDLVEPSGDSDGSDCSDFDPVCPSGDPDTPHDSDTPVSLDTVDDVDEANCGIRVALDSRGVFGKVAREILTDLAQHSLFDDGPTLIQNVGTHIRALYSFCLDEEMVMPELVSGGPSPSPTAPSSAFARAASAVSSVSSASSVSPPPARDLSYPPVVSRHPLVDLVLIDDLDRSQHDRQRQDFVTRLKGDHVQGTVHNQLSELTFSEQQLEEMTTFFFSEVAGRGVQARLRAVVAQLSASDALSVLQPSISTSQFEDETVPEVLRSLCRQIQVTRHHQHLSTELDALLSRIHAVKLYHEYNKVDRMLQDRTPDSAVVLTFFASCGLHCRRGVSTKTLLLRYLTQVTRLKQGQLTHYCVSGRPLHALEQTFGAGVLAVLPSDSMYRLTRWTPHRVRHASTHFAQIVPDFAAFCLTLEIKLVRPILNSQTKPLLRLSSDVILAELLSRGTVGDVGPSSERPAGNSSR